MTSHPSDPAYSGHSPRRQQDEGFALIVVLWVLGFLALALVALSSASTQLTSTVRNETERVRATLLLDAGIRLAMQDLLGRDDPLRSRRYIVGGPALVCRMPEGELVSIAVEDEGGKVDINVASDELIRALLIGVGVPGDDAAVLVDSIAIYRGEDEERRPKGAGAEAYVSAGRRNGPKRAVFDSVAELGSVLGIDPPLFQKLRPYVTTLSGTSGVDPVSASSALRGLLASTAESIGSTSSILRGDTGDAFGIPSAFVSPSPKRSFTIQAAMRMPSGGEIARRVLSTRIDGATLAATLASNDEPLAENMSRPRPRAGQSMQRRGDVFRIHEWEFVRAARVDTGAGVPAAVVPDC